MLGYAALGVFLILIVLFVVFVLEPLTFWWQKTSSDIANEPRHRQKQRDVQKVIELFRSANREPTRDHDPEIEELLSVGDRDGAKTMARSKLHVAQAEDSEVRFRLYSRYLQRFGDD